MIPQSISILSGGQENFTKLKQIELQKGQDKYNKLYIYKVNNNQKLKINPNDLSNDNNSI